MISCFQQEDDQLARVLAANPNGLSFLSSLSAESGDPRSHPEAIKYVKNFRRHKQELVQLLFKLYNVQAFGSSLPNDLPITWSNRLTKTAGVCVQRKMVVTKFSQEHGKKMPEARRAHWNLAAFYSGTCY